MKTTLITLIACCLLTVACKDDKDQTNLPDLELLPNAGGLFCMLDNDGKLVVKVKNNGTGSAEASVTEVDFYSFGKVYIPTPVLTPGASTDLTVDIPFGCFNSDCEFKITADAEATVSETSESNNVADGTCIG